MSRITLYNFIFEDKIFNIINILLWWCEIYREHCSNPPVYPYKRKNYYPELQIISRKSPLVA